VNYEVGKYKMIDMSVFRRVIYKSSVGRIFSCFPIIDSMIFIYFGQINYNCLITINYVLKQLIIIATDLYARIWYTEYTAGVTNIVTTF